MYSDWGFLAAYEVALAGLSPLPRAIYLMSRADHRSYREIADRLRLDIPTVETAMTYAFYQTTFASTRAYKSYSPPVPVAAAEAILLKEYRRYRIGRAFLLKGAPPFHEWLRLPRPDPWEAEDGS